MRIRARRVAQEFATHAGDIPGSFCVISKGATRLRPLPSPNLPAMPPSGEAASKGHPSQPG